MGIIYTGLARPCFVVRVRKFSRAPSFQGCRQRDRDRLLAVFRRHRQDAVARDSRLRRRACSTMTTTATWTFFWSRDTRQSQRAKPLVPVPAGWKPGNRLYRNNLKRSGKLSFTDVTEAARVSAMPIKAWAWPPATMTTTACTDLYVTGYEHNILYHNNGNGTFTDVTATAGVASSGMVHQRRLYRLRSRRTARSGRGPLREVSPAAVLSGAGHAGLLRARGIQGESHRALSQSGQRKLPERHNQKWASTPNPGPASAS